MQSISAAPVGTAETFPVNFFIFYNFLILKNVVVLYLLFCISNAEISAKVQKITI